MAPVLSANRFTTNDSEDSEDTNDFGDASPCTASRKQSARNQRPSLAKRPSVLQQIRRGSTQAYRKLSTLMTGRPSTRTSGTGPGALRLPKFNTVAPDGQELSRRDSSSLRIDTTSGSDGPPQAGGAPCRSSTNWSKATSKVKSLVRLKQACAPEEDDATKLQRCRKQVEELRTELNNCRTAHLKEVMRLKTEKRMLEENPERAKNAVDYFHGEEVHVARELQERIRGYEANERELQEQFEKLKENAARAQEKAAASHKQAKLLRTLAVARTLLINRAMQLLRKVLRHQGYDSIAEYLSMKADIEKGFSIMGKLDAELIVQKEVDEFSYGDGLCQLDLSSAAHVALDAAANACITLDAIVCEKVWQHVSGPASNNDNDNDDNEDGGPRRQSMSSVEVVEVPVERRDQEQDAAEREEEQQVMKIHRGTQTLEEGEARAAGNEANRQVEHLRELVLPGPRLLRRRSLPQMDAGGPEPSGDAAIKRRGSAPGRIEQPKLENDAPKIKFAEVQTAVTEVAEKPTSAAVESKFAVQQARRCTVISLGTSLSGLGAGNANAGESSGASRGVRKSVMTSSRTMDLGNTKGMLSAPGGNRSRCASPAPPSTSLAPLSEAPVASAAGASASAVPAAVEAPRAPSRGAGVESPTTSTLRSGERAAALDAGAPTPTAREEGNRATSAGKSPKASPPRGARKPDTMLQKSCSSSSQETAFSGVQELGGSAATAQEKGKGSSSHLGMKSIKMAKANEQTLDCGLPASEGAPSAYACAASPPGTASRPRSRQAPTDARAREEPTATLSAHHGHRLVYQKPEKSFLSFKNKK